MDGDHTTQGRWTGGQGDAMGHGMDAMLNTCPSTCSVYVYLTGYLKSVSSIAVH